MTADMFTFARARGNEAKIGQLNPLGRYGLPMGTSPFFPTVLRHLRCAYAQKSRTLRCSSLLMKLATLMDKCGLLTADCLALTPLFPESWPSVVHRALLYEGIYSCTLRVSHWRFTDSVLEQPAIIKMPWVIYIFAISIIYNIFGERKQILTVLLNSLYGVSYPASLPRRWGAARRAGY